MSAMSGLDVTVREDVDRWHRNYQRGMITLGELAEELAKLDRVHGVQPVTRAELLAARGSRGGRSVNAPEVCPGCGAAGVVVGLDCVLLETRPTVRRHVCGLGGPGSAAGA